MKAEDRIGLYLMSAKGHAVLRCLLDRFGPGSIAFVVAARDRSVEEDYYDAIVALAESAGLPVLDRNAPAPTATACYAVSWRWLIPPDADAPLIVFHDSLLPRYRGFAPLVSALVNGETRLGVTALLAAAEYDRGPIAAQESIAVSYPLKIADAISAVTDCYCRLALQVTAAVRAGQLGFTVQNEAQASYSLWRDEHDYFIDWQWEAGRIRRFVDAVGFPYLGAATRAHGKVYRVLACSELPDERIENRHPGKVIFMRAGEPVVVCGQGLLQIHQLVDSQNGQSALPLESFRTCFHTPSRL